MPKGPKPKETLAHSARSALHRAPLRSAPAAAGQRQGAATRPDPWTPFPIFDAASSFPAEYSLDCVGTQRAPRSAPRQHRAGRAAPWAALAALAATPPRPPATKCCFILSTSAIVVRLHCWDCARPARACGMACGTACGEDSSSGARRAAAACAPLHLGLVQQKISSASDQEAFCCPVNMDCGGTGPSRRSQRIATTDVHSPNSRGPARG